MSISRRELDAIVGARLLGNPADVARGVELVVEREAHVAPSVDWGRFEAGCARRTGPDHVVAPSRSARRSGLRARGRLDRMGWSMLWLFLALKIPLLALCWLVWWAIKQDRRSPRRARTTAAASAPGRTRAAAAAARAAPRPARRRRRCPRPPRVRPVERARASSPAPLETCTAAHGHAPSSPTARSAASSTRAGSSIEPVGSGDWSSRRRSTCAWATRSASSTTTASAAIDLRDAADEPHRGGRDPRGRAVRHPPGEFVLGRTARVGRDARRHRRRASRASRASAASG